MTSRRTLAAEVLRHVPASSRDWAEALLSRADAPSLEVFLRWHAPESLHALFEWVPPWPPPAWSSFLQHGLADWAPVLPDICRYLEPDELRHLRAIALEAAGEGPPERRGYRLFDHLGRTLDWAPRWGSASPRETLERGEGASLHLVQAATALFRALWIPARVVEEISLVPPHWVENARHLWRDAPEPVRRWQGDRCFYHPFLEFLPGSRWIPADVQRGWYGAGEFRQHLRVPSLLKLDLWTKEEYGRTRDRSRRYLRGPLRLGSRRDPADAQARSLIRALDRVRRLRRGSAEEAPRTLSTHAPLLDEIEAAARDRWQGLHPQATAVVAPTPLPPAMKLHLQAASDGPLRSHPPGAPPAGPDAVEIRIGASVEDLAGPAHRAAVHHGAHVIALLEGWGQGERAARRLVEALGGTLHAARPGTPPPEALGQGAWAPLFPDPASLELRLAPVLAGLPRGDRGLAPVDAPDRRVAWSARRGRGRITLAPLSLLVPADPHRTDPEAGRHRRLFQALLAASP